MLIRLFKVAVVLAIPVTAAIGFLPLVSARSSLDQWARDAGLAALRVQSNQGEQAARASVQSHPGVRFVYFHEDIAPSGLPAATVTLQETVNSFVNGLPGIRNWFRISSTQTSVG